LKIGDETKDVPNTNIAIRGVPSVPLDSALGVGAANVFGRRVESSGVRDDSVVPSTGGYVGNFARLNGSVQCICPRLRGLGGVRSARGIGGAPS
jgi:hypothetical protein